MMADGLAMATVRLNVGNARTLFGKAAERELISRNPFDHLPAGTTPTRNERYVTPLEAEKIIAESGNIGCKLVFALARYGGLRVPSETHRLTWADVDFERARLTVRSPKTERYAGHEQRIVPITSKLIALLQSAFDAADVGQELIIAGNRSNAWMRDAVFTAIKRAGVEPWDDLFRTLRSSCEREWAMTLPQYAVSKWLGHSIAVSGKHYAHGVPDELFAKAAQNPAQQASEMARNVPQIESGASKSFDENPANCGHLLGVAGGCGNDARTGEIDPSSRRFSAPACG
jgi:integrase